MEVIRLSTFRKRRARVKTFRTSAQVIAFGKFRAGLDGPVTSRAIRQPLRVSRALEKLLRDAPKK